MNAAPATVSTRAEEALEITTADPAGFWIRLAAYVIDMAIVGGGAWLAAFFIARLLGTADPIHFPAVLHRYFLGIAGTGSLFYFPWSWRHGGQTAGKRFMGIKVMHTDARPLELGSAFIRFLGFLLCMLCLGIPFLFIGFDSRKQGLHDKIARTYVIVVPKKKVRVVQPNAKPAIGHV